MSKTKNPIAATMEHMMPVGTIIEWCPVESSGVDLSTPAKVAAYYGFGTWEAYGAGRATVGTTSSHEPGETWGAAQMTLTNANMPIDIPLSYGGRGSNGNVCIDGSVVYLNGTRNGTAYVGGNVSGATPVNIEGPSIAVYRWRRIA